MPKGSRCSPVGDLALHAVEQLGLEEEHRVVVADRRLEQPLGVVRRRRDAGPGGPGSARSTPPATGCAARTRRAAAPPDRGRRWGTRSWPPDMWRSFAALLTIWSIARIAKFQVISSVTGRRPTIAAPTPRPATPASPIGVSSTRRAAELWPAAPRVHAEACRRTRARRPRPGSTRRVSSRSISSCSAWFTRLGQSRSSGPRSRCSPPRATCLVQQPRAERLAATRPRAIVDTAPATRRRLHLRLVDTRRSPSRLGREARLLDAAGAEPRDRDRPSSPAPPRPCCGTCRVRHRVAAGSGRCAPRAARGPSPAHAAHHLVARLAHLQHVHAVHDVPGDPVAAARFGRSRAADERGRRRSPSRSGCSRRRR